MQSVKIVFVQRIKEIFFIEEKIKEELLWIPLNLETLLFLKKNKKKYLDLAKILNNKLHREAILQSEKLIHLAKINFYGDQYLLSRYLGIVRKYFNSIILIIEILEKLSKIYKINKIYLSGWDKYDFNNIENNFFVSRIVKELYSKKYLLVFLNKIKYVNNNFIYGYNLKNKINYDYILLNNLGYNFKNFIKINLFRKKLLIIDYDKINWFKKYLLKILGVNFLDINKKKKNNFLKIDFKLPKINFKYKKYNLKNLLLHRNKQIKIELHNLFQLKSVFFQLFEQKQPDLVVFNSARGINNYIINLSKKNKVPCFLIPHGTISFQDNFYGKNYNKIIAEEITSNNCYNCAQTKVSYGYLKNNIPKKNTIISGNLIFSDSKKKQDLFYLYAVTNRDFVNTHFFGIETYYEFYKNLKFLDQQALKNNIQIFIKLHPGITYLKNELSKNFLNLKFTNKNLKFLLKKTIATISFSSTVIEDSLCSKVPVILFDQWQRYNHSYFLNKNSIEIKYVDSCQKLSALFRSNKISKKKYNFNNLIYEKYPANNFERIFRFFFDNK